MFNSYIFIFHDLYGEKELLRITADRVLEQRSREKVVPELSMMRDAMLRING